MESSAGGARLDAVLRKLRGPAGGAHQRRQLALLGFLYALGAVYNVNYVFVVHDAGCRCESETAERQNRSDSAPRTQGVCDEPDSFVEEFELACQDWKVALVGTAHCFGGALGLMMQGPISDRYGRKLAVIFSGAAGGALGLVKSFSRSYWTYVALETVEAAAGDPQSAVFTLVLELADKTDVGFYQTVLLSFYTGGLLVLPLVAWLVRGWRTLLRVLYGPALLALLGVTLLRDSPRWLLAAGKGRAAVLELRRAARTNRVRLDDRELSALQDAPPPARSTSGGAVLSATLRSPALRLRLLVCLAWWTTITLINYGMMIGSAHVTGAGDRFSNFALLMLMDVPANLSAGVALRRVGRRRALLVSFVLGGACCLVQAMCGDGAGAGAGAAGVARLVLFLVFETLATFSYNIVYVYTSELFPTRARNTVHAVCAAAGRLGALLAPQTPLLLHYWAGLPAALFGTLSLVSGALVPLMPETSHVSLPDTPHDAELMTAPPVQPGQPAPDKDGLTLLTEPTRSIL